MPIIQVSAFVDSAEAHRLAAAIDPLHRKAAPDHLTLGVAAKVLEAQALEIDALRDALGGMICAKDMKERLKSLHEMGHGTDYADYYRLKNKAWAAARAAIALRNAGAVMGYDEGRPGSDRTVWVIGKMSSDGSIVIGDIFELHSCR